MDPEYVERQRKKMAEDLRKMATAIFAEIKLFEQQYPDHEVVDLLLHRESVTGVLRNTLYGVEAEVKY